MKAPVRLLFGLAAFAVLTLSLPGAETTQARLYCVSVQIRPGTEPGNEYRLELTSVSAGVNSELPPDFSGVSGCTHSGYIYLRDEIFEGRIPGEINLNVPTAGDNNGDGFPDFFDSSRPVNPVNSSGSYAVQGLGSGAIQATWSRPAGSSTGTCVLRFRPNNLYTWKTFTHTFDILEYRGTLSYTPRTNTVEATATLARVDHPENQLSGPLSFLKSATNRFNQLFLRAGAWTNSYNDTLTFAEAEYTRESDWPTNYYGWLDFADGDPSSSDPDYLTWMFSIDALDDSNHNTIPDFSDDPQPSHPSKPLMLSVTYPGTNLLFTIQGETGRTIILQESLVLPATNWFNLNTLVLTNDIQTLSVPLPLSPNRFWRFQVQ